MNFFISFLIYLCIAQQCVSATQVLYEPIALYLTWQGDPTTTMTINWISPITEAEHYVEYRKRDEHIYRNTQGGMTLALPTLERYRLHRAELKHLQPDTEYEFRIGSKGKTFKFLTLPKQLNKPFVFVAGGDIYHDEIGSVIETNQQAAKLSPAFALAGGDLAYNGGKITSDSKKNTSWSDFAFMRDKKGRDKERWIEWLIAWKETMVTPEGRLIPIVQTIGNHEVRGSHGKTPAEAPLYYTFFSFPNNSGHRVFDVGDYLSVFVLDSGHTHPVEGEQTEWLEGVLSQRKNIPHKFAMYHVPAYPSVRPFEHKRSTVIRKSWVPLFEAYGVVAAFEHHDHCYKRTHPIKNNRIDPNGIVYMGDGAWGVTHPKLPDPPSKRWYLAKSSATRHFIKVELDGEKRSAQAIDHTGNVFDEVQF